MLRETLKRLEIRVRTRLPAPIRRAYRLALNFRDFGSSDALPLPLLTGCVFCASREEMLGLLPKGGRVAEIGTCRGDFARQIKARIQPSELHLVDIDASRFDPSGLDGSDVVRHIGLSHEVLARFPDEFFDFIYVDADHSYEGCRRDALAAAPKVRRGGYLAFNDFAHVDPWLGRYGVHRAATEFSRSAAWPMAFFAYHPDGLYDVAFRRPA